MFCFVKGKWGLISDPACSLFCFIDLSLCTSVFRLALNEHLAAFFANLATSGSKLM